MLKIIFSNSTLQLECMEREEQKITKVLDHMAFTSCPCSFKMDGKGLTFKQIWIKKCITPITSG